MQQPRSHKEYTPPLPHWTRGQLEALQTAECVNTLTALSAFSQFDLGQAALVVQPSVAAAPAPGRRAGEMQLESVKRKRSRKMNKHKYRKRLKKMRMGKLR